MANTMYKHMRDLSKETLKKKQGRGENAKKKKKYQK